MRHTPRRPVCCRVCQVAANAAVAVVDDDSSAENRPRWLINGAQTLFSERVCLCHHTVAGDALVLCACVCVTQIANQLGVSSVQTTVFCLPLSGSVNTAIQRYLLTAALNEVRRVLTPPLSRSLLLSCWAVVTVTGSVRSCAWVTGGSVAAATYRVCRLASVLHATAAATERGRWDWWWGWCWRSCQWCWCSVTRTHIPHSSEHIVQVRRHSIPAAGVVPGRRHSASEPVSRALRLG